MTTGNRSPLFAKAQPGGVFSVEGMDVTTGNRWYVDSGASQASDSAGGGVNPDAPFATLDYAIGRATANNGDIIYVMPGHTENLTAADTIDFDVAGITVIGLGQGADIPTFTHTLLAGSVTIQAASTYLKNLKFVAGVTDGVTAGITIAAAGDNCTLDGIIMRDTLNTQEFLVHVTVATTVADLTIKNCDFLCLSGGSATNSILFAGTTSNLRILNTFIFADSTDSVVDHLAGIATNAYIDGLTVYNEDDQTAGYVLDFHASSTGIVTNCRGAYNKVDAAMTKGDAMWWIENYFSNTIAESGLLEPASTHAIP
jgi:hypothetical protein